MGLFKKVIFADTIATYSNTVFTHAASGSSIGAGSAWLGVISYTLQLYFDFSGYSDMAIGLGCIFGLRLPLNFNSPLKATNIIDFWRRWHMTMSRFFTNYIYTPLATGQMRRSLQRKYSAPIRLVRVVVVPVIITFTLAGLWHGPGWGFIVFGLIHGVALAINHIWRELRNARNWPQLPNVISWGLTLLVFVISLVFFRADSIATALQLLGAMFGLGGAGAASIVAFYGQLAIFEGFPITPIMIWITLLACIALFFPNTQEILRDYAVALDPVVPTAKNRFVDLVWKPNLAWAIVTGIAGLIALSAIGEQSPFLYYQF
jgi:alginate O-acetyltransferase complex protein AlgI